MCKHCENSGGMIRVQDKIAYVQGDRFRGDVLVRVGKSYKILIGSVLTAPIQFCPKCGRRLTK